MQLGNGLWESTEFDPDRLQPTQLALGTATLATDLLKVELGYEAPTTGRNNGNVWSQRITAPRVAGGNMVLDQVYGYDTVNRLTTTAETGGAGAWSRASAYDPFGNRTVNVGEAQTISTATNQVTGVAGMLDPGYDSAGNMTFHPTIGTLAYDAENRQTSFSTTGKSGAYVYDGEGKRVRRTPTGIGEPTTIYVYDAFGKLTGSTRPARRRKRAGRSTARPTTWGRLGL